MLEMPDCWEVTTIPWELYRDTVVKWGQNREDGAKLWKKLLLETDLIIGGLDFEGDYLYVSGHVTLHHTNMFVLEIPVSTLGTCRLKTPSGTKRVCPFYRPGLLFGSEFWTCTWEA